MIKIFFQQRHQFVFPKADHLQGGGFPYPCKFWNVGCSISSPLKIIPRVLGERKNFANLIYSFIVIRIVFWGLKLCFLLFAFSTFKATISASNKIVDWSLLDPFQNKITKEEFTQVLGNVYCPRSSWFKNWIKVKEDIARIRISSKSDDWYDLSFISRGKVRDKNSDSNLTLSGYRIALDPGHIGGVYSQMEGRHFSIDGKLTVKEGDITLKVAKVLRKKLQERGAVVSIVRSDNDPVTEKRPKDFLKEAEDWMINRERLINKKYPDKEREDFIKKKKEVLFYRVSEIYARAQLINEKIKPDLVICLHLNAAPWDDPDHFSLVTRNDYHVLVNGCYMGGEVADDKQRFEMIFRLLNGWHETEKIFAENISKSFSEMTGLPAFKYKGPNAVKVGNVEGVWGRNLLANRVYLCPVIFLEPYVANSVDAYKHILMGDYTGRKMVSGKLRTSLVEEYAESVFLGIQNSYPIKYR